MLILAPHEARLLAGFAAALFFVASLYAGLGIAFALGFAIANALEALLILRGLRDSKRSAHICARGPTSVAG